jgi:signal transduction histidine kinase
MRRLAVLFIILIILPAIVLSVLAWQTARSQQAVLERQEAQLRQQEVERAASRVRGTLLDAYRSFSRVALELAARYPAPELPARFDEELTRQWQPGAIGFIAQEDKTLLFPTALSAGTNSRLIEFLGWSRSFFSSEDFTRTLGSQPSGILGTGHNREIKLIFWIRSSTNTDQILGAMLDPRSLASTWKPVLEKLDTSPLITLAILDQTGIPVVRSAPLIRQPLNQPFATVEIGESLPGWKMNLYLENPEALGRSADRLRAILFGLIATAMLAIVFGGSLLLAETRRQRDLALKKVHFVSNVTHELKTPLTSIKMFSEMLSSQAESLSERQQHYLQIIHSETERLRRLIDQVLDFSKLEKGKTRYRMEKIELKNWLQQLVATQQPVIEQSGGTVELILPESECPGRVDPDALTQMVLNLLSNAEKYNRPHPEIEIELSASLRETRIEVRDRGPGLPAGSEEKIFEPFHRVDDALDSETQGTGLGLSLARGLARDHGGDIIYRPRPGGGSIFSILLPPIERK